MRAIRAASCPAFRAGAVTVTSSPAGAAARAGCPAAGTAASVAGTVAAAWVSAALIVAPSVGWSTGMYTKALLWAG